jgi:hypothetical protein
MGAPGVSDSSAGWPESLMWGGSARHQPGSAVTEVLGAWGCTPPIQRLTSGSQKQMEGSG